MKIALIQQRATRDKQANVARGLANLETAARHGATLACYAELAFEWFHPQRPASGDVRSLAEPLDGPLVSAFREKARMLGIVVVPQAGAVGEWPEGLYEAEMRVAAFQNGYYTALCNRVGREDCLDFAGESFVCAPDGRVTARAGQGTEEILYADVDPAAADASHARQLFLKHRRPGLYAGWLGK